MKNFLFFAVAFILFNCTKKADLQPKSYCLGISDPPPPPTASHPYNYIKYKRNGKEITFKDYPHYEGNNYLRLYTHVEEGDSSIAVSYTGKSAVGKYTKKCNDFEVEYLTYSLKENKNGPKLIASSNTQPSSITISQNDTIVKGTFTFYLTDDSGNKASLTNGEFQFKK